MDIYIDSSLARVLALIYKGIEENSGEIFVSSPEYKQTQVDALVSKGLVKKIDASTNSGWEYLLRPTYEGENVIEKLTNTLKSKVDEFIKRGIDIGNKEANTSQGPFSFASVKGPMFDAWMGEINIFNERHLKNHPLHDSIHSTYFHRKNRASSYDDMMGHLRALAADDEFLESLNKPDKGIVFMKTESLYQMLVKDIERCQAFLDNGNDEASGIDIYTDITSRYDSIIPDLGYGLYQYIPEHHFYDPEITGETLVFNLKKLLNKMTIYLALNFPENTRSDSANGSMNSIESKPKGNKVFIVHGHDNEAKQEVARTLEKAGFEAIILHEQADGGLTIIEKIEKYTDVAFAVVLYTECDLGRSKETDASCEKFRARQNVVFEHGYLIGRLGRNNVCAIVKGNVETPGDISGVVYTPMDKDGAWKIQLGKNIKNAGLDVDFNKLCY
jgi:predicted nucleotide-binding protein